MTRPFPFSRGPPPRWLRCRRRWLSRCGNWKSRSCPGDLSLSIISSKVTTFMVSSPLGKGVYSATFSTILCTAIGTPSMATQGLCASSGKENHRRSRNEEKRVILPRIGIRVKLDIGLVGFGYGKAFARSHFHELGARYHHLDIDVIPVRLETARFGHLGGIALNDRENPLIGLFHAFLPAGFSNRLSKANRSQYQDSRPNPCISRCFSGWSLS